MEYFRYLAWFAFWTGLAYWLASSRPSAPRLFVWFSWLIPFLLLAILSHRKSQLIPKAPQGQKRQAAV